MIEHLCIWHFNEDMQRWHNSFAEGVPLTNVGAMSQHLCLCHLSVDVQSLQKGRAPEAGWILVCCTRPCQTAAVLEDKVCVIRLGHVFSRRISAMHV